MSRLITCHNNSKSAKGHVSTGKSQWEGPTWNEYVSLKIKRFKSINWKFDKFMWNGDGHITNFFIWYVDIYLELKDCFFKFVMKTYLRRYGKVGIILTFLRGNWYARLSTNTSNIWNIYQ